MPTFRKRPFSGAHSFRMANGKKVNLRPGDMIECEQADLGNCKDQYEELTPDPHRKKLTDLERETDRYYQLEFPKSRWLNHNWKPGFGVFLENPVTANQLQQVLDGLRNDLEKTANNALKVAWEEWKYRCQIDASRASVLLEPQGRYLENIACAEAKKKIIVAEIKEIRSRLKKVMEAAPVERDHYRAHHKLAGSLKKRDHRYYEVDGYPVEYRDSKPFVPELGIPLDEYLQQVKTHKAQKRAAGKSAKRAEVGQ